MALLPRTTFLSPKDMNIVLRNCRILFKRLNTFTLNKSFSVNSFASGESFCCRSSIKGMLQNISDRRFSSISCENAPYLLEKKAKLDVPAACRVGFSSFSCGKNCSPDLLTRGNPRATRSSAVHQCSHRPYKAVKHGDHPPVLNPIEELQKHVAVPLIPEDQIVFSPTEEEIVAGQSIFLPGHKQKIKFLKSAVFKDHLPEYDLPEVGFIGRSNVGKSSLIKMLFTGVEDLSVRVSKNPGHTKTLNFFQVGQKLCVVDMPGYGFNMPTHFRDSVEHFIATRPNLSRIFFLVDGSVGVTETDVIGLNMLEEFHTPFAMTFLLVDSKYGMTPLDAEMFRNLQHMNVNFCIVVTKIDKARPALVIRNLMSVLKYRDKTSHCFQQPFLVSSITGDGVALLQTFIAYVTGNVAIQGL